MGLKELRETLTTARKSAFAYPSQGGGGMNGMGGGTYRVWDGPVTGSTFLTRNLPGTDVDYETLAGVPWFNSVVMSAIRWTVRTFNEAPLVVRRRISDPLLPDPIVEDHPLTKLYRRPSPGFTPKRLSSGYLLSRMVDGTGYLVKNRSATGKVVELHYAPHFLMRPIWTGNDYITAYEYRVDNKRVYYDPKDVICMQDGTDPDNPRRGISGLRSVMREIVTDNEAATYAVSILKQMGVPGAVIAPAIISDPRQMTRFPTDFIDRVKTMWGDRFTGDGRGKPVVFDFPVSVDFPQASPESMALDKLRSIPVDRVLTVIGINSTVLHLQIQGQPKFSNYREAREQATEEYLVPLWKEIAEIFTVNLLQPDFNASDDLYVDFWTKDVKALQGDLNGEAIRRRNQAAAAKILTDAGFDPEKALEAVGLPAIPFVGTPPQAVSSTPGQDGGMADDTADGADSGNGGDSGDGGDPTDNEDEDKD